MRLYLASRSPRRRELLSQMGVAFDTLILPDALPDALPDHPVAGEYPASRVKRMALSRAKHGQIALNERHLPARPVLAADTLVEIDGEIFDKPLDAADAGAMLRRLSGQTHRVLTGVAVSYLAHREFVLSTSEVRLRPISDDEIRRYLMSGESTDKAGAYSIHGRGGLFVEHIAGSHSGIIGLPVCETGEILKRFGFRLP